MTIGEVLEPLARRHAHWLSLDPEEVRSDREEAEADVRAMQLILRMERAEPPRWSAALAAACAAATALCLDERAEPSGEWHAAVADYVGAHIRKVTRRARASQWEAVDDLAGLTVSVPGAQVRALLPGPVTDLDKRVSKLQVGGTDVPIDLEAGGAGRTTPGALLVQIPAQVAMTAGKLMAQTGHAGMITAALLADSDPQRLRAWRDAGLPVTVRLVHEQGWRGLLDAVGADGWPAGLVAVRDAGFTEIEPGTVTVIADATAL